MEELLLAAAGSPVIQLALLFAGPFVLEEAAIVSAAALAAAGELPPEAAFASVLAGVIASDWLLYAAGYAAGRSSRIRTWIGPDAISRGRKILGQGVFAAAVMARLVPWLLFPIFVTSGFLHVGFARFAIINATIAFGYTLVAFLSLYLFNMALFDLFAGWGWLAAILAGVTILAIVLLVQRRYRDGASAGED